MRLAFLSPTIVDAIVEARGLDSLNLQTLITSGFTVR
jgi:hypothetical protein